MMEKEYASGTVEAYNDRSGFGIIIPDDPDAPGEKYLFSRSSLRDRASLLEAGSRIYFRKQYAQMGTFAVDVHSEQEIIPGSELFQPPDTETGTVTSVFRAKGYGFIGRQTGPDAFFHFTHLDDPLIIPDNGAIVNFKLVDTVKGLQALNVTVIQSELEAKSADGNEPPEVRPFGRAGKRPSSSRPAARKEPVEEAIKSVHTDSVPTGATSDLLAQAILAREARHLDKAAALYARGMHEAPSVQLILSYAALEKNRNRKSVAMEIYEDGIRLLPNNAKLREDAGVLAASMRDYPKALQFLGTALDLYRRRGAGEVQVLQWLARVNYQIDTRDSLLRAIDYFEEAALASRRRGGQLSAGDTLLMDLARIRAQHDRGALTFTLLNQINCTIRRANLHEQSTVGADLVVEFRDHELTGSYGISGEVLLRCMFQNKITRHDVDSFDQRIREFGASGLVDEQLAFLIVASLPQGLETILFARIGDRKQARPAIIPLTQKDVEDILQGAISLRDILNKWLYRRDLFAVNSPVVGRRFFGRDRQIAQLRDAIATGTSSGVFGLRKVGKTSLLKEVQRRSLEAGDLVVFIDLLTLPDGVIDAGWIYWKIASQIAEQYPRLGISGIRWQLGGKFGNFLEIPQGFPVAVAFDADLENVLKALRKSSLMPQPKVVVLLDEIERILPTDQGKSGFTGYFDFLGYLRGVSQEQSPDFVLMVTGANAAIAEIGQFNSRDNPVFNFFNEIYLTFLQPEECDLMIQSLGRGMGLQFPDTTLRHIYSLTGGHPFFARQLCSYIAQRCADRPLTVSDGLLTELVDYYLEFCGSDFAEITERLVRDYRNEFEVLRTLAGEEGTKALEALTSPPQRTGMALKHLVGYQLVRLQEGQVSLTMDLFRRWLTGSRT
jgi:cold shock CspA family protein/tetratricopeptide (TPR) repeat protein